MVRLGFKNLVGSGFQNMVDLNIKIKISFILTLIFRKKKVRSFFIRSILGWIRIQFFFNEWPNTDDDHPHPQP